jgi:hypothetical protein
VITFWSFLRGCCCVDGAVVVAFPAAKATAVLRWAGDAAAMRFQLPTINAFVVKKNNNKADAEAVRKTRVGMVRSTLLPDGWLASITVISRRSASRRESTEQTAAVQLCDCCARIVLADRVLLCCFDDGQEPNYGFRFVVGYTLLFRT